MKTQIFDSILQINNKYSSNEQIKCSKVQKSSNKQKKVQMNIKMKLFNFAFKQLFGSF